MTLKDLKEFIDYCKANDIPNEAEVYIGNDEEVNGIHKAEYCEITNGTDEYDYFFDFIQDDNIDREKPNIFIS